MVSRSFAVALSPLLVLVAGARAQTFSSFQAVEEIQGILVEQIVPLKYRVLVGLSPALALSGSTIPITDLIGFWALSEDDDLSGGTTGFGVWSSNASSAGPGAILGWTTSPSTGIGRGLKEVFVFDSLNTTEIEYFGFYVRLDGVMPGPAGGNTAFIYVPAPGPAALLMLAGLSARRRRR